MSMPNGLERPVGMNNHFYSPMRAFVVSVDDPEQRMRVRARVIGVHPDEVPNTHIPWAEVIYPFASKLAGDFHHFEAGDAVWVQFEGGDPRLPVVIGAWVSHSGQLNDVPNDITANYAVKRRRWIRLDRAGNKLEMSEVPSEMWAKLVSGTAEVIVDQKDGSVTLKTLSGPVVIDAGTMEINTKFYALTSGQVIINANDLDTIGGPKGLLQILANYEINIHSDTGEVIVGGYPPKYRGVTVPGQPLMAFRQTPKTSVRSRDIQVGTSSGEVVQSLNAPETETIELNGVKVTITAQAAVTDPSTQTVGITINAVGGKVTIQSDSEVDVIAPTINITSGSGGVNLS